jgi:cobalt-zinc-cadmium efflux system outer membrane protein
MNQFRKISNQAFESHLKRGFKGHLILATTMCFVVFQSLLSADLAAQEKSEHVAPNTVESLTLRDALVETLKSNPRLIGFEYDIRAAEARIMQAGLLPNPSFDAEIENFAGSGVFRGANAAETTLSLGQLIELGGKREARTNVAKSHRVMRQLEYEVEKREVLVQTTQRFIDVLKAQRRVIVNEEIVELTKQFEPTIQKRIEAGKGNPLELTKSKIAISSATIELDQAKRALLSTREKLSTQWGVLEPRFTRVQGEFEKLESVASLKQLSDRLDANPLILSHEGEHENAKALMEQARAKSKPDVKLWGGVRQHNLSDDTAVLVGVSIPLPLFDRNQGGIQAASEEQKKVEAQHTALVIQLNAELAAAYRKLSSSRAEIEVLQSEVIPGAEKAQKQVKDGFQVGLFGYLEVLDTQRTLSASRLQLIQAFSNYREALAEIEGLVGTTSLKSKLSE